jgi:hypothetical protein
MDLQSLVLRHGMRARAAGRVVAYEGKVWFDPPLPVPAIRYAPGHEPPPRPSRLGVLVRGVDLGRLSNRFEKDGGVSGWASLTGTWRDGYLDVVEQSEEWREQDHWQPVWVDPPCSPPADGWPRVPAGSNIEPSPPETIPGMVSVVLFRPTTTQVVLVVASSQPDAAEALLRPLYGDALCVVPSRWTPEQVESVRQAMQENWAAWRVYETGNRSGEDAQVTVTAKVVQVVPAMADWSRSLPYGIADVTPWLRPLDLP